MTETAGLRWTALPTKVKGSVPSSMSGPAAPLSGSSPDRPNLRLAGLDAAGDPA